MRDLRNQLQDYIDHVAPPRFTVEQIVERARDAEMSPFAPERQLRPRPGWVVAVVAAMVTLVVVGGMALWIRQAVVVDDTEPPAVIPVDSLSPSTTLTDDQKVVPPLPPETTVSDDRGVSTPLMTWRRIEDVGTFGGEGTQAMLDVAVGDGLIVGVGYGESGGDLDAAVWYSQDASTWSRVAHDEAVFGGDAEQRMHGVIPLGSGFLAVGFDGDASEPSLTNVDGTEVTTARPAVWRSEDGIGWERVPADAVLTGEDDFLWMTDVAARGSTLVAVGVAYQYTEPLAVYRYGDCRDGFPPAKPVELDLDAAVWTSIDGRVWTRVEPPGSVFGGDDAWQRMYAVAPAGPGFVAVGQEGFDFIGVDEWTPLECNNPEGTSHVMDNVAAVWTSPDGETWTRVATTPELEHTSGNWATMFDVVAGGPGVVAVGIDAGRTEPAAVWTSPDGSTWQRMHQPPGLGNSSLMDAVAATDDGRLVAAGGMDVAGVWSSLDGGTTWVRQPDEEAIFGVIPGRTMFGSGAAEPDLIFASINGLRVVGDSVVAVGSYDEDAGVWIGTWTDTDR